MLEVKGTLAKLLAQEDLIVEHRQVETAQFDVEKRILPLPMWEKAEASVIDMLIAHEVGHALYTPNEWDFVKEIPLSYVNVVEDVRIEKLMKRRYAGIVKTFYNGYKDINKKDFFQLQFADLEEFALIDRINLFYKVGSFWDIPFNNAQEIAFRDECAVVETFDQVKDLARRIAKYQKEQVSESTSQTEATEGTPKKNLISRDKKHLPRQNKKTVKSLRSLRMILPHPHNLKEKGLRVVRLMAMTWKQLQIQS